MPAMFQTQVRHLRKYYRYLELAASFIFFVCSVFSVKMDCFECIFLIFVAMLL